MDVSISWTHPQFRSTVVRDATRMAAPTWAMFIVASALQLFCIGLVTHYGPPDALPAMGLSLVFCNVTGTSMVWGLAAGLDTLSSQALGAGQKKAAGLYCVRAVLIILLLCFVPVALLWSFARPLLTGLGQAEGVAAGAAVFARWRVPGLLCLPLYTCVSKTLNALGLTAIPGFVSVLANICSGALAYALIVHLGYGVEGAAIALSVGELLQAVGVVVCARRSPKFMECWPGLGRQVLKGWTAFLSLSVPALVMQNAEWWSWEVATFLAGLISTKVLAAQTILANVLNLLYWGPLALSFSGSAIVGRRLGSVDPAGARRAGGVVVAMTLCFMSFWLLALVLERSRVAWLLAGHGDGEDGVAAMVVALTPYAALYHAFDGAQCAMTGVVRGAGQQRLFAPVIAVCYWVIGLPLAALLAFEFKLGEKGLWYGMITGACLHALTYFLMLLLKVSFKQAAQQASDRLQTAKAGAAGAPGEGSVTQPLLFPGPVSVSRGRSGSTSERGSHSERGSDHYNAPGDAPSSYSAGGSVGGSAAQFVAAGSLQESSSFIN